MMHEEMEIAEKHTLHHFSHQHPLESTISSSTTGNITCCGCNLRIMSEKDYYNCKTCKFSLHRICSNMPRKTRHPAHPSHYLTLFVSPPSLNNTIKCQACGHSVTGFYYNCAECGIYYHVLCSALPLSVAIFSHPHTLRIEFSLPYDFNCDLCDKPSYLGWLYRCRFCEFDAHISCAISNQRAKPVLPLSNSLTRQIICSSTSIMETNRLIDYGIESNELMQLVVQGVARGNQDLNGVEFAHSTAVAGWDERLQSPRQNNEIRSGGIGRFRSFQREQEMSSTFTSPNTSEGRLKKKDPSTPVSEDLTIPSYQFSDLCFSIDLMKTCSSQVHKGEASKEASYQEMEEAMPKVEAKIDHDKMIMLKNTSRNLQQLDYANKPVFNPLYRAPENWLNEASLLGGGNGYDEKLGQNENNWTTNGHGSRAGTRERNIKSNAAKSRCLCWWKLLSCCRNTRYKKCSKSFKNGGL